VDAVFFSFFSEIVLVYFVGDVGHYGCCEFEDVEETGEEGVLCCLF